MSKDKQEQETNKEIIRDLNRQIKAEKDPERKKSLIGMKKRLDLWDRAMSGDTEALIEAGEQRGLYKKEEEPKKEMTVTENQKQLDAPKNTSNHMTIRKKESKDGAINLLYKKGEGESKIGFTLDVPHEETASDDMIEMYIKAVKNIVGVKEIELANHILQVASSAIEPVTGTENASFMNIILQFLHDVKPRDAIEAQLAAQAATLYTHAMANLQRMGKAKTVQQCDTYTNISVKLSRAHNETVESLNRHRRGGEQKVTVTHAVLANQAIVNNYTGGGVSPENRGDNPCQQYAAQKPEPTKTNPVGNMQCQTADAGCTVENVPGQRRRKAGKSSKT